MNDINEETPMTDSSIKHLNRLYLFIRKLLKLVPQDKRENLKMNLITYYNQILIVKITTQKERSQTAL